MSLSNLNSLCQENKISIKKIFLMLIRGVSVPNTHSPVKYRIVCWLLLWSQYPSSWSAAKDHSLSAHISWDRENECNWIHISLSLFLCLWCPQGSYSSLVWYEQHHLQLYPQHRQMPSSFLSQTTKCPSLKLGASHVMMTFLRKDSLWHKYITKYNVELLI